MPALSNLLADIPAELPDELIQSILQSRHVRIERIVSLGHASPERFWYDQETHEWVLLLAGAARLRFDDGQCAELAPGSFLTIPAHRRHRVEWTDPARPTVWLAVYFSAEEGGAAGAL